MNKKMSKRQKDMKSKLMAAICMLLVSSIMMVSTTYAWFTLSTAPEVTGITTAVGANGNLEMALLPVNGLQDNATAENDFHITSGTNDSMANQDKTLANVTWGNLVDLDGNSYGLNNITLYPAALNYQGDGKTMLNGTSFLSTPIYGADGRVSSLESNTLTGIYQSGSFTSEVAEKNGSTNKNPAGVRVIGTSNGMTDQQLAFRNAISNASSATVNASQKAGASLNTNAKGLGDIVLKYAGGQTTGYTDTDKAALSAMIDALGQDNGPLDDIENAIRYYAYAWEISQNEAGYAANEKTILETAPLSNTEAEEGKDNSLLEQLTNSTEVPSILSTMITKLAATKSSVDEAKTELNKLTSGSYSWDDLNKVLSKLIDINKADINGVGLGNNFDKTKYPVDGATDETAEDEKYMSKQDAIINAYLNSEDKELTLNLPTNSGVYADIADFAGNVTARITLNTASLGVGISANVPCNMLAYSTLEGGTYQAQAKAVFNKIELGGTGSSSTTISSYYGYIIDLAFKTNASGSSLLLQSDAVDRIYNGAEDSTYSSDSTMGNGSTMTFTPSGSFDNAQVLALMENIKIVFFNPSSMKVICYGMLDTSNVTYPDGAVRAKLKVGTYNDNGDLVATDNNEIMELSQNEATRLSVLVYLDGENVTNADVAFDSASSMTGSLNLQFASSANLVPMVYSDFKEGSTTTPTLPTGAETLTTGTVTTGYTASVGYYNNAVYALIQQNGKIVTAVSGENAGVKIGNKTATYNSATKLWKATATAKPNDKVDVTITGTATVEDTTATPNTYTATLASDSVSSVTLKDAKVENGTCTFQLDGTSSDKTYTVTYSMGDTTNVTLTAGEDGNYTISSVTGNITIKVVENSNPSNE